MKAPSLKALSEFRQLEPRDARLIRALATAAADGEKLKKLIDGNAPATTRYASAMHGNPYRSQLWRNVIVLHALNQILGTHGIEGLGSLRPGDYAPAYEYLNAGDPHVATLIYDRNKDRLFVGSWGALVEKHPEWESGGGESGGGESGGGHALIRRTHPQVASGPRSRSQLNREIEQALASRRGRW